MQSRTVICPGGDGESFRTIGSADPGSKERRYGDRYREVVQCNEGFGFIQPDDGSAELFVHVSAVERAGMRGLNDGQKITYELVKDRKSGKMSADNLRA